MFYVRPVPPTDAPNPADTLLHDAETFRSALRVHCYRMLGSISDVDDVLQDVMLRAWRARESLADATKLLPWLYRIATRACLDALAKQPARVLGPTTGQPAADPAAGIGEEAAENLFIEPVPTAWIEAESGDPTARLALKQSITLAFVTALQTLTPMQRATLLLCDVVELKAEEAANALEVSLSAVNSALFRARTALRAAMRGEPPLTLDVDHALLARYVAAWETSDVETIVAMLHEDVRTTMPPRPTWIDGLAANRIFYRTMFGGPPRARLLRIVVTSANAAPALAFYRAQTSDGPYTLRALKVLAIQQGAVVRIDHFTGPRFLNALGLPHTLVTQGDQS